MFFISPTLRSQCKITLNKTAEALGQKAITQPRRALEDQEEMRCAAPYAGTAPEASCATPKASASVSISASRWMDHLTLPQLVEALKDQEDFVCEAAADALGRMGPAAVKALPQLVEALKEEEILRKSAADALGEMGPAAVEALPQLVEALKDDKEEMVREAAADALGKMGQAAVEALPQLVEALKDDKEERVRAAAAGALAVEALPQLVEALKDDKEEMVREAAAHALGKMGPAAVEALPQLAVEALPQLVEALKDDKEKLVRRMAAAALAEMGPAAVEALPQLVEALKDDKEEMVRKSAADALGEIGPAAVEALPQLVEALKDDKEEMVREAAACALGKIGPAAVEALPQLVEALKDDKEEMVREAAACALGKMGPAAVEALPQLVKEALEDQEVMVCWTAADALSRPSHVLASVSETIRNINFCHFVDRLVQLDPRFKAHGALLQLVLALCPMDDDELHARLQGALQDAIIHSPKQHVVRSAVAFLPQVMKDPTEQNACAKKLLRMVAAEAWKKVELNKLLRPTSHVSGSFAPGEQLSNFDPAINGRSSKGNTEVKDASLASSWGFVKAPESGSSLNRDRSTSGSEVSSTSSRSPAALPENEAFSNSCDNASECSYS